MSYADPEIEICEVLRACGVVWYEHERSPYDALDRHAKEYGWRDETVQKWIERLDQVVPPSAEDDEEDDGDDYDYGDGDYSDDDGGSINSENEWTAIDDVLQSCQVRVYKKESAFQALHRHADENNWRDETREKWLDRLRDAMCEMAESCFDRLNTLNRWLVRFELEPCSSIRKAHEALEQININIYDLIQNRLHKRFDTVEALRTYTIDNNLIFPRERAKSEGVRAFLRRFH